MAEVTFFSRIEPRPRTNDLERGLAAEVRDPYWFLCRQWQVGEFEGEDTGSVAFVEFAGHLSRMPRWIPPGGAETDLDQGAPLEQQTLREPFEADLAMQVELGQDFIDFLREEIGDSAAADALVTAFLQLEDYQINELEDEPSLSPVDPSTKRFLMVCARRNINGFRLYTLGQGVAAGSEQVPPEVTTDASSIAQIEAALGRLVEHVGKVFGEVREHEDPATWRAERLEYRLSVIGVDPSGAGNATHRAYPDRNGVFDWYSFDVASRNTGASEDPPEDITDAMIPTRIHFDGMPSTRFWNFEESTLPLPNVQAEDDDLMKVLITDFMIVHSHDWYLFPFEQDVGSLVKTDHLVVHDVFGKLTVIKRADEGATAAGTNRFTLFSITDDSSAADGLADYFIVPPSPGPALQLGAVLEDVRFGRDEMANMAWGIERVTQSPIGEQRSGRERNAEIDALRLPVNPEPSPHDFPLRYEIESEVPANWIPLLPVQPDPNNNPSIALQRGAAVKDLGHGQGPEPVPALSLILNPSSIGSNDYLIEEEEVPRSGLRVERVVFRSRWLDGSTHLWVQRRRQTGAGESQSGLLFDQALPNTGTSP